MSLGPGQRVGEHVVEARLGEGGMGAVYAVVHATTGARRALKVLTGSFDAAAAARLVREGEALATTGEHPHVVRIHAAGAVGVMPYLVMELCAGGDLAARLRGGPLPFDEAARIVAAVARGTAHVHARGIVHRDIKPQNVLFDAEGRPKLTDFGLARLTGAGTLTATGALLGTPAYMAPEQVGDGHTVDARADVWALGGVLLTALTGRPPYEGATAMNIVTKVLRQSPAWPSSAEAPPALQAILRRAMARAPDARYPTAEALAEDLERFLRGDAPAARPPRRLGATLAALGAVGLTLALVAVWLSRTPPVAPLPPPPSSPPSSSITPSAPSATDAPRRTAITEWTVQGDAPRGNPLAFIDAQRLALGTLDGLWFLRDDSRTPARIVEDRIQSVARTHAPDRIFTAGSRGADTALYTYSLDGRQLDRCIAADAGRMVVSAPGDVQVVAESWHRVVVWRGAGSPAKIEAPEATDKGVIRVAVRQDGRHLVRVLDTSASGYDFDGTVVSASRWTFAGGDLTAVSFAGDDVLLAAGLFVVRLAADGSERARLCAGDGLPFGASGRRTITAVAEAHDGSVVATVDGRAAVGGVWVWPPGVTEGRRLRELAGRSCKGLALSPDARRIAVVHASEDEPGRVVVNVLDLP